MMMITTDGTMLNVLYILSHLVFISNLWGSYYQLSSSDEEESESES